MPSTWEIQLSDYHVGVPCITNGDGKWGRSMGMTTMMRNREEWSD
jgi:hypothetical protein